MSNFCKIKSSFNSTIIILTILLLSAFPLSAEYKIATIDIGKILNDTPESKSARVQLDNEAKSARARIEKQRTALKQREEKLVAKKVAPDSPEVEQFRKDSRDLGQSIKKSEEELRTKFTKMNNQLTDKAMKIIEQYAKSQQIDLVLDKGAAGRGPVLFGTPHVDITNEILARMKG